MVLGTPTSFMPFWKSSSAIFCEPSPPMVITASIPSSHALVMTWSEMSRTTSLPFSSVLYRKGLPRLVVPRIVPPRGRMPLTCLSVSSYDFSGQIRPSKPSGMPMTFHLYFRKAHFAAARMTALRPGASPPPVQIPMQRMSDMVNHKAGSHRLSDRF